MEAKVVQETEIIEAGENVVHASTNSSPAAAATDIATTAETEETTPAEVIVKPVEPVVATTEPKVVISRPPPPTETKVVINRQPAVAISEPPKVTINRTPIIPAASSAQDFISFSKPVSQQIIDKGPLASSSPAEDDKKAKIMEKMAAFKRTLEVKPDRGKKSKRGNKMQ